MNTGDSLVALFVLITLVAGYLLVRWWINLEDR